VDADEYVYLMHALAALFLLTWLFRQYGWKKASRRLKGEQRTAARTEHEQKGQLTLATLVGVVMLAIIAKLWTGVRGGESLVRAILPSSLHGATGFLGLALFYYLWSRGRMTKSQREQGEVWSVTKQRHGRAADLIIIIGCIHAFLGFLELLKVL